MALRPSISKNGLQLLQQFLGLKPSDSGGSDEIVFVSIDFEYLSNIKQDSSQNLNSQIGISILDTRDLLSSPPQDTISTYNFVTGSPSYCAATTGKYLFGETITIHQRDILSNLESLIPRTRNIVLVGHEIAQDLKVLQLLHFDLHTSIVAILDTRKIVSTIFPNISHRLSSILSELQCPFQYLHVAGNDAYFTLRAFLLLALKSYADEVVDSRQQRILTALEAITNVAIPTIPKRSDPQAYNIKKKQKRLERSRKHQSKSWDMEKQEQIRAERAARRAENERSG